MSKILIVDDDTQMVKLFHNILSKEGFEVLTANNGQDCLRIAKEEIPDLILLDLIMPEMDGGSTAQDLADDERTKNIPIAFLTSMVSEEEARKEKGEIGGRLFISKSTNREEFINKIKIILKHKIGK